MSFNKRYIDYNITLFALQTDTLKSYYGNTDALIFEDSESDEVYELFVDGRNNDEILTILNNKNNGRNKN
jgi:hypothetical protein